MFILLIEKNLMPDLLNSFKKKHACSEILFKDNPNKESTKVNR